MHCHRSVPLILTFLSLLCGQCTVYLSFDDHFKKLSLTEESVIKFVHVRFLMFALCGLLLRKKIYLIPENS